MSAVLPATEHRIAPETHCTVTLRVSSEALVNLQLLAVDIRSRSGASVSRSAILRSLIRWMEMCDVDTSQVRSSEALRNSLLMALPCTREI